MEKRVSLITGASGGIGRAILREFAQKGWMTIGVDRAPFPGEFPEESVFIQGDISSPEDWKGILEEVMKHTDHLDVLINNAAVQITKPLLETTLEEWDLVMKTNLRSVFLSVKSVFDLLKKEGGGAIVNVSSVHAVATSQDIAAYATSKGGILALTRAMAIEFAADDVRVNAVLPGAVDTNMLRNGLARDHAGEGSLQQRLENLASNTVNGRIGQPEEVARAIFFLADREQSSFITGQPMIIDGGATSRLSTE